MCKFSQVSAIWQKEYKEEIEYYTYQSYLAPLKDANDFFGNKNMTEITAADVKGFIDKVVATGKCRQTVNLRLIVVNHVFKYALIQGIVSSNPTLLISLPRNLPKTVRDIPADAVIETIQNHPVTNQFWMLAKCLLYLGLRRGEVMALSKDCIDFDNNKVTVSKQVEYHNSCPKIKLKMKTKAGYRIVIIPDKLKLDLLQFCKSVNSYLFVDNDNTLLKLYQIRSGWDGLNLDITMHQLRHAYATILFEAGVDEKIAQRMLGHASIVTMKNIYTHIRESQIQKAELQINKFLVSA